MEEQLTTKQVAEALRVSESSVKRWCNCGAIHTVRTVGGHRRIPMGKFLEFLERTNRRVEVPTIVSAPALPSVAEGDFPDELRPQFLAALERGDEAHCRRVLTSVWAATKRVAYVADEFIATAFREMGERWNCGSLEVFQERRACEICSRLLHEFRRLLPQPPADAPLAIGGSPAGDPYTLASQLVELVLLEQGWRGMNLGCNLPLSTLVEAVRIHQPRMLWLSVSHMDSASEFPQQYEAMRKALPADLLVVVGGRALTDQLRPKMAYTGYGDNLQQFAALVGALRP